jgi:hypothetical protein
LSVGRNRFNLAFGKKINTVFRTPVPLDLPLLSSGAANIRYCHSGYPDFREGFFDFLQPMWPDYCHDHFHVVILRESDSQRVTILNGNQFCHSPFGSFGLGEDKKVYMSQSWLGLSGREWYEDSKASGLKESNGTCYNILVGLACVLQTAKALAARKEVILWLIGS